MFLREARWRLLRAIPAASVITAGAVSAHMLGGAPMPDATVIVRTGLVTAVVCLLLVGVRLGPARLVAAVLAGHLAFHHLFAAHAGTSAAEHVGTAEHAGGSAAHAHVAHGAVTGDVPGPMVLTHLALALVTGLLLHHGESLLHRCLELARCVADRLLPARPTDPAVPVGPHLRDRPPMRARRILRRPVLCVMRWRGPPSGQGRLPLPSAP
ncbi:hypothetical protein JSY14_07630 [Brachybacterium sp. EF45031]|uniref:hypothetical protein n=1 Tax=Brachybacterium sillae TaxID=2810536 RepID=UPI00217E6147|nr:hypothetical protein [Brachybacterium sillae]MCS6711893.1 hypothetical protein [Brachybacterium sillae]